MRALAIGTIATTLAALVTLIVLLFWTASDVFDAGDDDDGGGDDDGGSGSEDRWWNVDLKREELAALGVVSNLMVLVVSCGTLFVPMTKLWHPSRGSYDRFNLGALAASTFMVGNMLFVSFWCSANYFAQQEEENGSNDNDDNNDDGNDDGNDDDGEMDEEELLAYHQKIVSYASLVLALAFSALSICVYNAGKKLPEAETGRGRDGGESHARARSAAHAELFSDMWRPLSACTVVVLSALLAAACALSWGEEGERAREEGSADAVVVLPWLIVVAGGTAIMGRKILDEKKWGALGVGMLSGGTKYFALLLFVAFALLADPAFEGRRGAGGAGLAAAFACLVLSLPHLAFSLGTYKYRDSIMMDACEETEDPGDGEFRRMEDEPEAETGTELI